MSKIRFAAREGSEQAHLEIPVHPKLREIIDASRSGHLTFLVTAAGKPFTAPGFTNWFRDICNAAGLPKGLSVHATPAIVPASSLNPLNVVWRPPAPPADEVR